ncbi:MAG TPA: hypothetical protein PL009_14065 [Flavipsychrobacter sp.]|nr:hypothetical protein [Flavipsychrobacter sp.]
MELIVIRNAKRWLIGCKKKVNAPGKFLHRPSLNVICVIIQKQPTVMSINNDITRKIFEGKYPYQMPYYTYLRLLEKGFGLLETVIIETRTELSELKAIRIALEYRMEVIRQVRKKQIKRTGITTPTFAATA